MTTSSYKITQVIGKAVISGVIGGVAWNLLGVIPADVKQYVVANGGSMELLGMNPALAIGTVVGVSQLAANGVHQILPDKFNQKIGNTLFGFTEPAIAAAAAAGIMWYDGSSMKAILETAGIAAAASIGGDYAMTTITPMLPWLK